MSKVSKVKFSDLRENMELGPSEWRPITGEMIDGFANLTFDHNLIHKNEAYAQGLGLPHRAAHGLLVFSCAAGLLYELVEAPCKEEGSLLFRGIAKLKFHSLLSAGELIRVKEVRVEVLREYDRAKVKGTDITLAMTVETDKRFVLTGTLEFFYKKVKS